MNSQSVLKILNQVLAAKTGLQEPIGETDRRSFKSLGIDQLTATEICFDLSEATGIHYDEFWNDEYYERPFCELIRVKPDTRFATPAKPPPH